MVPWLAGSASWRRVGRRIPATSSGLGVSGARPSQTPTTGSTSKSDTARYARSRLPSTRTPDGSRPTSSWASRRAAATPSASAGLDRAPGQADLAGVLAQVAGPLHQHQLQVVGPVDRGQGEQHRRRHPGGVAGDDERQPGHPVQQRVAHPPSIGPIRPGHASEPAVDHQGGAGDVAAGVGGEQQQRRGQLLDVGPAAEGDLGDQGPAGLRVRPHAAGELGPDPAGGQAVDPHPVAGPPRRPGCG